jgi:hypothetical protein
MDGGGNKGRILTAATPNSPAHFTSRRVSICDQVVVKLADEIVNSVEVRVSLKVRGTVGNKVIVKVKP